MSNYNDSNPKNVEDMALADLLGMSGSDERVQEREDEPGSGIARLAQMVAASSVESAKQPSIVHGSSIPPTGAMSPFGTIPPAAGSMAPPSSFPPTGAMSPFGSAPPGAGSIPPPGAVPIPSSIPPTSAVPYSSRVPGMSTLSTSTPGMMPMPTATTSGMPSAASYAPQPAYPAAAAPQQKNLVKLAMIGGGVAVVLIVVILLATRGGDEKPLPAEDSSQVAALEAKLKELENQQVKMALDAKATVEKEAPTGEANEAHAGKGEAPVQADAVMEFAEPKAPDQPKKKWSGGGTSTKKATSKTPKAKDDAEDKEKEKEKEKEKSPSGGSAKSGAGGLDDLLASEGSKGKEKESAGKQLPSRPSKADVKTAMVPVTDRAEKCSKYSKGTVNLRIIVASNGRVKQVTSTGGTASAIAANCVTMMARTAKFPEFSDASFTINYPIKLK